PTEPRTPSVPKYLRAIASLRQKMNLRPERSTGKPVIVAHSLPYLQRRHRFAHIMHAHDARAALDRQQRRGHAGHHALVHWQARDLAQRALARPAREQRIT